MGRSIRAVSVKMSEVLGNEILLSAGGSLDSSTGMGDSNVQRD